ncbi:hypothetical protein [Paraburkholderia sp. BR14320]|uniref:hypothetical protein n=1 Tax=unclassified Paraburkholderia TaxID=2615204 RepID=UPI0034CD4785
MPTYKYLGMKYSQGDSSTELVSFCAAADDIVAWGGVPAKNERFHGGFQRALGARYRKIIDFFNSNQTSPGAVVVAFREGQLTSESLSIPTTWGGDQLSYKPDLVQISFTVDDDETLTLDELRKKVALLLAPRVGVDSLVPAGTNGDVESGTSAAAEGEDGDADTQNADTEGEEELDVGQSKLRDFYEFISDDSKVLEWLGKETTRIDAVKAKGSLNQEDKEFVAFTPEEKLKATLKSLLRPAMIVDGQHRVNGANESDKDEIVFTVCAIKDADWIEQVFQFVVLNKMARPISKDFLTELLNTSLTNSEIEEIDKKLESVGIKNSDRIIHKYINHDPRSPFLGTVAEASESAGFEKAGKLSQQGMLTVAKRWRAIDKGGKSLEMAMFSPALQASNLTLTREKWKNYETWVPFFFTFWSTLKEQYSKEQVWVKEPHFHLLYIVTLQALQDVFLESKAEGDARFTSLAHFAEQVREFFDAVPGAFFQNWSATGLQSGTGWADIKDAIRSFRKGQKLSTVKKESPLFR